MDCIPPTLSIVMPAFNEAIRLPATLARLLRLVDASTQIIVVDDGSTDRTTAIAHEMLASAPRHTVVSLPRHVGKGAAVRAGVRRATGRSILFMDADNSTDLRHVDEFVARLDFADVVIGSRHVPGADANSPTFHRRFVSRLFNSTTRQLTGLQYRDTQCGFKAFRAPAAKLIFQLSRHDGYTFDVELLVLAHRFGFIVEEVPVRWRHAAGGHVRARDAALMFVRVAQMVSRDRSRTRVLPAVEVLWSEDPGPATALLNDLHRLVDRSYTVLPWTGGAVVVAPLAKHSDLERTATSITESIPHVQVRLRDVAADSLLEKFDADVVSRCSL